MFFDHLGWHFLVVLKILCNHVDNTLGFNKLLRFEFSASALLDLLGDKCLRAQADIVQKSDGGDLALVVLALWPPQVDHVLMLLVLWPNLDRIEHVKDLLTCQLHIGVVGADCRLESILVVLARLNHACSNVSHDVVHGIRYLLGHDEAILQRPRFILALSLERGLIQEEEFLALGRAESVNEKLLIAAEAVFVSVDKAQEAPNLVV